ncbi:MAG: hypothetical protein R2795_15865 [Saprospiraceae bacterium]
MKAFLLFVFGLTLHFAQAQQQATLLGRWQDMSLDGSSAYDNTYNEIWGLAIGDREYAVIGSTAGTHFIDVTQPAAASEVFFVPGASSGTHHSPRLPLWAAICMPCRMKGLAPCKLWT